MLGGKGKTKKRKMIIHVNQIQRTTAAVSVWAAPALLMNFINEAPRRAIISWLEYLKESPFYQCCTEKKNLTSGRNLTELHVDLIRRINSIKPDIMQLFFERYQYKIYARVVYQRFWKSSVSTTHPALGGGQSSKCSQRHRGPHPLKPWSFFLLLLGLARSIITALWCPLTTTNGSGWLATTYVFPTGSMAIPAILLCKKAQFAFTDTWSKQHLLRAAVSSSGVPRTNHLSPHPLLEPLVLSQDTHKSPLWSSSGPHPGSPNISSTCFPAFSSVLLSVIHTTLLPPASPVIKSTQCYQFSGRICAE